MKYSKDARQLIECAVASFMYGGNLKNIALSMGKRGLCTTNHPIPNKFTSGPNPRGRFYAVAEVSITSITKSPPIHLHIRRLPCVPADT